MAALRLQQERDRVAAEHKVREEKFKRDADIEAAHHEEERKSHSISRRLSHSVRASFSAKSRESFTVNPMRLAGHAAARYDTNQQSARPTTDVNLEVRPDTVEGWLELKSFTKVWWGPKYKKCYFRISESSSSLQYFHTEDYEDQQPAGYLDLRLASEAGMSKKYSKDGVVDLRDACRFTCAVDALVFVFKAPQPSEARLWVHVINLWREYLLIKLSHAVGPLSEKRLSRDREEKEKDTVARRAAQAKGSVEMGDGQEDAGAGAAEGGSTAATVEMTGLTLTLSGESVASADSAASDAALLGPSEGSGGAKSDESVGGTMREGGTKKPAGGRGAPNPNPNPNPNSNPDHNPDPNPNPNPNPRRLKVAPRASRALSPALLAASGIAVSAGAVNSEALRKGPAGAGRRRSAAGGQG